MTPTDVRSWLEAGDALRSKLAEERAQLVARLAAIDSALRALGAAPLSPPVARQVAEVLRAAGRPMTAREVAAALSSVGRLAIGNALYQGVRRGEFAAKGRKGSQAYTVRQP